MTIRNYRDTDIPALKDITVICFDGVSIDQNIEKRYGLINGKTWQWRKARHIDADALANAAGIFVAEEEGRIVGYITTRVDYESRIGGIPNIAVLPGYQGRGVGRALMEKALAYFQEQGMLYARIETLDQNPVGTVFYPKMGFQAIARQIHYVMPLDASRTDLEAVMADMETLLYPTGRCKPTPTLSAEARKRLIEDIAKLPEDIREATRGLTQPQLDTPYRPGGWTIRQVVHHLADSHLNSYIRFRLAVTEDAPTIKPYDEKAWGELTDARQAPVELSLSLLDSLHARWTLWMSHLGEEDWRRSFIHPESGRVVLDENLQIYAWHGRHHLAHITGLKERMGW